MQPTIVISSVFANKIYDCNESISYIPQPKIITFIDLPPSPKIFGLLNFFMCDIKQIYNWAYFMNSL